MRVVGAAARSPIAIVIVAWLAAGIFALVATHSETWGPASILIWVRLLGWAAAVLLIGAIVASPIARVATRIRKRRVPITQTRRALGLAAAASASVHAAAAYWGWLEASPTPVWTWGYLRAGLFALIILVLLALTSFPRLVRAARIRLWKPLHRLAYVAAILTAIHLIGAPFAPRTLLIALIIAVIGIRLLGVTHPHRKHPKSKVN